MTAFDYAVLAIVGLSVLLSVVRGLVREVLALAAWVTAFVAASLGAGRVAQFAPEAIGAEELRLLAGFALVFVTVLVAASFAALGASRLVRRAGLGVEDRLLGSLFGLSRGLLVVLVLVLAAGLTSLPRQRVWREAALSAPLEAFALELRGWLPAGLGERIRYDR